MPGVIKDFKTIFFEKILDFFDLLEKEEKLSDLNDASNFKQDVHLIEIHLEFLDQKLFDEISDLFNCFYCGEGSTFIYHLVISRDLQCISIFLVEGYEEILLK